MNYFSISLLLFILPFCFCNLKDPRFPASELDIHIWPQPKSLKSGENTIYVNSESFKFTTDCDSTDLNDAVARYY